MAQVKVTLVDGSEKWYPAGINPGEIASEIGPGLSRSALIAKVNDTYIDLNRPITEDARLEIVTFESKEGKSAFRHTAAHILAQAVKRLYPSARLGIGPSIEDGFYYDFDVETPFSTEDLERIEKEMRKIVKENYPLERIEVDREEAVRLFSKMGEAYKVELIRDLPQGEKITCYRQGEFIDLCTGPHVPSTGKIKAFKLLSVAGAYWRGDEKNPMLQRIYGTAFPKKTALDEYLQKLEEARKRDHRKLGKQLDLFSIQEEGPGFPFFHPKGMVLRNILEDFWRKEHRKRGYQEIKTPIILHEKLWRQSGHWDHYKENMYFTNIDNESYAIKPMNCPGSMLLYRRKIHSYRDLPLRVAELGLVHRHELSGTLHGLMRVRCFTQDDAHIFMLPSQVEDEIVRVIDLVDHFYRAFGFDYHVELSTRPEKAMGSVEIWDRATAALKEALERKGMEYKVNEGDGAFYGPKIDFHLEDALGRTWQCATIQLDFLMPERFDLTYIGPDGGRHRPVMIHRVVFGAIERFIAILTEHYAGAFPVWLSPVQVKILTIADRHRPYAEEIKGRLEERELRVEEDYRDEKIGYKVRQAELEKVPYMLVIGDHEVENGSVAVRERGQKDRGLMSIDEFMSLVEAEVESKG